MSKHPMIPKGKPLQEVYANERIKELEQENINLSLLLDAEQEKVFTLIERLKTINRQLGTMIKL